MTSLLLMPAGVDVVRAEDAPQASKSGDPMPSPSESEILQPPRAAPPIPIGDVDEARQPGHPADRAALTARSNPNSFS